MRRRQRAVVSVAARVACAGPRPTANLMNEWKASRDRSLASPNPRARSPCDSIRRVPLRSSRSPTRRAARATRCVQNVFRERAASRHADFFRKDDFVGERIFQDAVLMDARFVSESVRADYGFIRRHGHSRDGGKQAAGGVNFLERMFVAAQ